MQYNRPIDSHGFQFISTASDHENFGIGNLVADLTIATSMESLGAGFMGRQGIGTGGRPLLGMIPGVMPSSFVQASGKSALESVMAPKIMYGGHMEGGAVRHDPWKGTGVKNERQFLKAYNDPRKMHMLGAVPSGQHGVRNAMSVGDVTRMGFGLGLRSLSSAWIVNDLFSMGFAAASGAIQGMTTFSYERRNRETPADSDLGEGFAQTRASHTQRQTAMAAIHNSQMNTRSAMGNEATFMHV
jgi:hypothetical protein